MPTLARADQKLGQDHWEVCLRSITKRAHLVVNHSDATLLTEIIHRYTAMALNIRNPETERLAADLARLTGESKTQAVTTALKQRLVRVRREQSPRRLADELDEIALHCAALPLLDERSDDEILGYGDDGLSQ
jgi:antitoxin VapB